MKPDCERIWPKVELPTVWMGPRTLTVLVRFSTSKRSSPRMLPLKGMALLATKSQLLRAGVRALPSVRGEVPSV